MDPETLSISSENSNLGKGVEKELFIALLVF